MIRVYPPGRSPTFGATSLNSSATASFCLILLYTIRLLCVVSSLDFVIIGSTNCCKAFAFATVVLIRLCSIKEHAIFANIEFLCAVLRPKWFPFFPCLMTFVYNLHLATTHFEEQTMKRLMIFDLRRTIHDFHILKSRIVNLIVFSLYLICIYLNPFRSSNLFLLLILLVLSRISFRSF